MAGEVWRPDSCFCRVSCYMDSFSSTCVIFTSGKETWIADYAVGKHFEARLAHVHENLFAFINIVTGYLLVKLPIHPGSARAISWLTLTGMLMPVGILSEVLFGLPPVLVLIGGVSIMVAMAWFGVALLGWHPVSPDS